VKYLQGLHIDPCEESSSTLRVSEDRKKSRLPGIFRALISDIDITWMLGNKVLYCWMKENEETNMCHSLGIAPMAFCENADGGIREMMRG